MASTYITCKRAESPPPGGVKSRSQGPLKSANVALPKSLNVSINELLQIFLLSTDLGRLSTLQGISFDFIQRRFPIGHFLRQRVFCPRQISSRQAILQDTFFDDFASTSQSARRQSIPPMCAMNMSSKSVLSRRSLQSKLLPTGAMPPCSTTISMQSNAFFGSEGNSPC